MPEASFHFPKGFLWGTATSSHQVEGGNDHNNWSRWENEPGRNLRRPKSGVGIRLVEWTLEAGFQPRLRIRSERSSFFD